MRDFIGMEQFFDEEFSKRIDHREHSMGSPHNFHKYAEIGQLNARQRKKMETNQPWANYTDIAWIICLLRGGAIDQERAVKIVKALDQCWDLPGVSGEERLVKVFDGDMDLASTVNYGRTLQEPMWRLKLRDLMLDVFDDMLELLELIHKLCMENLETVMVGRTHMNHGQPITYAHFMLSAFDGIYRSLEQFELAWRFTNLNSGGCGSCAGTTWPVDREYMAELLGLDGVMEATYDCEASQDHSYAIMFALSNMAIHISRYSMNHYIWALDEIDTIRTQPSMCGISSFMPQKCDSGSGYEHVRISCSDVLGETVKAMFNLKGEPHGDVLPAMLLPNYAINGMIMAQVCMLRFSNMLRHIILQKDRMRSIVKSGYSCATEVATFLIQHKGYGGRLAHSIVATMVRNARVKGLKSYECTGEMLDEAAAYLGVKEPGIDTATLQKCFDPDEFIKSHNHLGGTAPEENKRLLGKRRINLDGATRRHHQRREKIRKAIDNLCETAKTGKIN